MDHVEKRVEARIFKLEICFWDHILIYELVDFYDVEHEEPCVPSNILNFFFDVIGVEKRDLRFLGKTALHEAKDASKHTSELSL
jgi:hypothetical protein